MLTTLEPVRPIALSEIRAARERIAKTIVRTPLVRLELGPEFPDIRLKLENLQPINAYKLRGQRMPWQLCHKLIANRAFGQSVQEMPARVLPMQPGQQAFRAQSLLLRRRPSRSWNE